MLELLQQYSIKEIVIFVIVLAAAIKGIISFWDWGVVRLRKIFNKETNEERRQEEINNKLENDNRRINELIDSQKELQLLIEGIATQINALIDSDKDDIKSFIVKEHHHFCYNQGWIDDYSMDVIEKRFKHYQDEGGNSYVEELMRDLRQLEHIPPQQ